MGLIEKYGTDRERVTVQDVDAASPSSQRAWRKAAFKFRALDLEAGGGGGADWLE